MIGDVAENELRGLVVHLAVIATAADRRGGAEGASRSYFVAKQREVLVYLVGNGIYEPVLIPNVLPPQSVFCLAATAARAPAGSRAVYQDRGSVISADRMRAVVRTDFNFGVESHDDICDWITTLLDGLVEQGLELPKIHWIDA